MKVVKIVLGILIVISLAFFCTGLIIKENQYSYEITINKPLESTFELFNDQEKVNEWIPEITKIESINSKPGKVGSEYRVTMENEGVILSKKEKILAFVKNKKVTYYFNAEGVYKTDDYTFESDDNKTIISLQATYTGKSYLMNCVLPYFKGVFKDVDVRNLNSFKAYAEK